MGVAFVLFQVFITQGMGWTRQIPHPDFLGTWKLYMQASAMLHLSSTILLALAWEHTSFEQNGNILSKHWSNLCYN